MKKSVFLSLLLALAGCSSSNPVPSQATAAPITPSASVAGAVTYTCSMHPEVTSDKPGKCPKCKMDLVVKK